MAGDQSSEGIIHAFTSRINSHDNQAIFDPKADDFVFIDSGGKKIICPIQAYQGCQRW